MDLNYTENKNRFSKLRYRYKSVSIHEIFVSRTLEKKFCKQNKTLVKSFSPTWKRIIGKHWLICKFRSSKLKNSLFKHKKIILTSIKLQLSSWTLYNFFCKIRIESTNHTLDRINFLSSNTKTLSWSTGNILFSPAPNSSNLDFNFLGTGLKPDIKELRVTADFKNQL